MGERKDFNATRVWNTTREVAERVPWVHMVWFSQCIPKHAFNLWLVMLEKLTTLDKIKKWKVDGQPNFNLYCCALCMNEMEDHKHLFMDCHFSRDVWSTVKGWSPIRILPDDWGATVTRLMSLGKSRSVSSIVTKLLFGAFSYHIWKERNGRIFRDIKKSQKVVAKEIVETVRLKLMSLKFKNCPNVARMSEKWELPRGLINYIDDNG